MSPIHVVLADDHPVVRAGIRTLLEQAADILVVAETDNGAEVLALVAEYKPDVLLLDMEMPGLSGMEVAQQLRGSGSGVLVLALSAHDDREYIRTLLASGAAGYLIKEEAPETIVEAVRGIARGEKGWISRRAAAHLSSWVPSRNDQGHSLTNREVDVLRLVTAGKTNQEIGLDLGISEKTVEKHLASVFAKLRVASRVEAAVMAIQEKLV